MQFNCDTYTQTLSLERDGNSDNCPSGDTTVVVVIHNCEEEREGGEGRRRGKEERGGGEGRRRGEEERGGGEGIMIRVTKSCSTSPTHLVSQRKHPREGR